MSTSQKRTIDSRFTDCITAPFLCIPMLGRRIESGLSASQSASKHGIKSPISTYVLRSTLKSDRLFPRGGGLETGKV